MAGKVEAKKVKQVKDPCPDCGSELIHQEGIEICRSCGWQSAPV